jgi:hypothetical protein
VPCWASVKLPPATARFSLVGTLCMSACVVPVFVGEVETTSGGDASEGVGASSSSASEVDEPPPAVTTSGSGEDSTGDGESGPAMTTGVVFDLPTQIDDPTCLPPPASCDEHDDAIDHALGLNCEGGVATTGALAVAGPEGSRAVVVGALAGEPVFAPTLGSRAVVLSTGVAAHVPLTPAEAMIQSECSQVGLPCPSTSFDGFDLQELPAPLEPEAIVCPEGQPLPGPGDCSGTIDEQWQDDPRIAYDYTELRLDTVVPDGAAALRLDVAFFTAERPKRFPGGHNDLLIVWLESERWTGNFAVHPEQDVAIAADALDYLYTGFDPELAAFAFAEHAATGWIELGVDLVPGDAVTLVVALLDGGDDDVDSAVLLDNLHWLCVPPNAGPPHP